MVSTKNAVTAPSPLGKRALSIPPAKAAGAASSETENEPVSRSACGGGGGGGSNYHPRRVLQTVLRRRDSGSWDGLCICHQEQCGQRKQPGSRTAQKGPVA